MKIIFCFFQCLVFFSISWSNLTLEATTFHSILIGDTDDQELNKVVKKDLLHMQEHMQEVFQAVDQCHHFNQKIYSGKKVNFKILEDLQRLDVAMDDMIFLYFSGHGFNTKQHQLDTWPFIYFTHGNLGISAHEITEILMQYQPRLLICFFDCCNNILKLKDLPIMLNRQENKESLFLAKSKNICQLFQANRGIILISSASPGYYSEGTDENGSCFTNAYLQVFKEKMASKKGCSWNNFLSNVQNKLWKRQRPYYELMLD